MAPRDPIMRNGLYLRGQLFFSIDLNIQLSQRPVASEC